MLKRHYTHIKQRQESYYNPYTSVLWSEVTGKHEGIQSLSDALTHCDTTVLTVLPDRNGKYPEQKDVYSIPGIEVKKFLSKTGTATIKFQGKTIHIYPVCVWFEVKPGSVLGDVLKAKKLLQKLLEDTFQPVGVYNQAREREAIPLLASPSQEGLMLLQRSLPYGQEYVCHPEVAEGLLNFTLQGRIETFYHGQDTLDNLHYYDGRWMYASCLRHVPQGPVVHDNENTVLPYVPGFYRVEVRVPDSWEHIGLLPLQQKDGTYRYPRTHGERFETWATHHEVSLAIKHKWHIHVLERYLWPETEKNPEPLRVWGEKLIKLRMEAVEAYPEPYKSMLKAALRKIMLQALGAFNRTGKEVDHYAQNIEDIPEETTSELWLPGDIWKYTTYQDLTPLQAMFYMPHWIKSIWGEARKKLAEKALEVPFTQLVALRVDGIWTNCQMNYTDTGKVGQFTRKPLKQTNGLHWPHDNKEMVQLVRQVKG